ncbi:UNVERIFIED_CONTAM: hypothetical protein PYX00_009224 [Menopon gallinae]|uniref:Uncharacterized protein n=1 Tax=Menopon gallinae TaxID=328185 RepID=A0AAW2HB41_9NEOP
MRQPLTSVRLFWGNGSLITRLFPSFGGYLLGHCGNRSGKAHLTVNLNGIVTKVENQDDSRSELAKPGCQVLSIL